MHEDPTAITSKDIKTAIIVLYDLLAGGHGSGNYGHSGRDEVGGSGPGASGNAAHYDAKSKSWKTEDGKDLPEHVKACRIPPAWKSVKYADDPNSDVLATGRDSKGRHQAIYSERFRQQQADAKFARVQELDMKYEEVLRQVDGDLRSGRNMEEAATLHLIMVTGVRPGSEADTGGAKKAYGATTLEGRHVIEQKRGVRLRFTGKKGVENDIPVEDRKVAADLLARKAKAGSKGRLFDTDDGKLRKYTGDKDGKGFKTKDFRTLLGTRTAVNEMRKIPRPKTEKEYSKAVRTVAKTVANKLGNTPTVALQSYINPAVFADWRLK